jgi:hypothetical protein
MLELRLRRGQEFLGRVRVPLRNVAGGEAPGPLAGFAALAPAVFLEVSLIPPRISAVR